VRDYPRILVMKNRWGDTPLHLSLRLIDEFANRCRQEKRLSHTKPDLRVVPYGNKSGRNYFQEDPGDKQNGVRVMNGVGFWECRLFVSSFAGERGANM
jgi:hypothetical protein